MGRKKKHNNSTESVNLSVRENLGDLTEDSRHTFRAQFKRWGRKSTIWTLLFINIRQKYSGNVLTDHLWFKESKSFKDLREILREGDIVEFDARVKVYRKGYWGENPIKRLESPPRFDYKLAWPTNIKVVGHKELTGE